MTTRPTPEAPDEEWLLYYRDRCVELEAEVKHKQSEIDRLRGVNKQQWEAQYPL